MRIQRRVMGACAAIACIALLSAQRGFRSTGVQPPPSPHLGDTGRFTFARLRYVGYLGNFYYRGLPSWQHGFNDAEHNLLSIMREVTDLKPRMDSTAVVAIDDPELFKYPVVYMTEAGYWELTDKEAEMLRKYLLKGGFVILDDSRDGRFPGNQGWANIDANFKKILPGAQFVDLTPAHPIFHSFFDIASFDVVRQYYDAGRPQFRAIFDRNDPSRRIMVLSNFNTDISNYWEFSPSGFAPVGDTNEAYELGVNYLIYALTH